MKTFFEKYKFLIASTIVFAVVFSAYFLFNIIATEGFNPSDDGVILAQAFRILNGEIPHKDFISIRPVFSGILHTIHFFSHLALEVSARWFVFFQYFIYSILTTFILFQFVLKGKSFFAFILLGISSYLLNLNFYNLFPWTTIDALFWFSIGLYVFLLQFEKQKNQILFSALGFTIMSFGVLSRQTFAIPFIILFISFAIYLIKERKIASLLVISFISSFPFLIYLFVLVSTQSFSLFITQMTGRTELLETGILTYLKYFIGSKILIFHLFVLGLMIFHKLKPNSNKQRSELIFKLLMLYSLSILFFSYYLFLSDVWQLFEVSFEIFFICFILLLYVLLFVSNENLKKQILTFLLLICWTSSISLGDNSLVFTIGILINLFFALLILILNSINKIEIFEKKITLFSIIASIIVVTLLFVEISAQRRINYRDDSSDNLNFNLSDSFSEFGNIKTNKTTYDYFAELKQVIDSLKISKNNFVVIPNNSIIYAITKSKNPFPIDWLQQEEYIGSEKYLHEKIAKVCSSENIYLIIDKYDSKKMNEYLLPMDYNTPKYEYFNLLNSVKKELKLETKFFKVYIVVEQREK